jgi:hypothetical protein
VLVVIVRFGPPTVSASVFVAVAPLASFTVNVSADVVVVVGVPEMTPLEAVSESPAGSVPAVTLHVSGAVPPLAARVVV